jgi:uncharacterized protein (DUF1697 family)
MCDGRTYNTLINSQHYIKSFDDSRGFGIIKFMCPNKYVAFLRGINVGGNNLVKMDVLRKEFKEMGFHSVNTYIQSGNVLFESTLVNKDVIKEKIAKALAPLFKVKIKVLVRSQKDMAKTVAHFPKIFKKPGWKHNVIFLSEELDSKSVLSRFELKNGIEVISYSSGVLFWSAKMATITRSNMLKLSARQEYQAMTVRNVNTTKKIFELMKS